MSGLNIKQELIGSTRSALGCPYKRKVWLYYLLTKEKCVYLVYLPECADESRHAALSIQGHDVPHMKEGS